MQIKSTLLEKMLTLIAGYVIAMFALRVLLRVALIAFLAWGAWDVYSGNYENSTPVMSVIVFILVTGLWGVLTGRGR